jgi:hypothetical protein
METVSSSPLLVAHLMPTNYPLVVITGMMSWLLLEAHLGILAACLPTIRFLFKGLSPESVINSVRSALSLRSLNSMNTQNNDDREASRGGLVDGT